VLQGSSIAVPGFHVHFLSSDRRRGGHVLDCTINVGSILMHPVFKMVMAFPRSDEFLQADLSNDCMQDIEAAERGNPQKELVV
jgi:acetolactate decarboxylase